MTSIIKVLITILSLPFLLFGMLAFFIVRSVLVGFTLAEELLTGLFDA